MSRISKAKEKELITAIKSGLSIAESLVLADIDPVTYAEHSEVKTAAERAHKQVTSRIRQNVLAAAVDSNDLKVLSALLDQRDNELEKESKLPEPRDLARGLLAAMARAGASTDTQIFQVPADWEVVRVPPGHVAYVVQDNELNRTIFGEAGDVEQVPPFRPDSDEMPNQGDDGQP